jgi:intracellular sulfur oxidation DsrE/DsrF family protein
MSATRSFRPSTQFSRHYDPKTHGPAIVNVYNSTDHRGLLSNGSTTFDVLMTQGVHFAVCEQSTHSLADTPARNDVGDAENTFKKLTSHLIGNSHMVRSGIVAVGHAQERGFPYVYCG